MKTILRNVIIILIISSIFCVNVCAESYALLESSTGKIVGEKNGDAKVNAGALTKLMTVLITAEKIEANELKMDKLVCVNAEVDKAKGAIVWLTAGERITVYELLKGLLIGNASDCSIALACEISKSTDAFVKLMNEKAKMLGMKNTQFADCVTGCVTTAKDMAILSNEISKHDILKQFTTTWMDYIRNGETMLVNNNKLIRRYDGCEGLLAGATKESGWCISSVAKRDNIKYVCVVLGEENEDKAFSISKEMLSYGYSAFSIYTPDYDKTLIKPLTVEKGIKQSVNIKLEKTPSVIVKNGRKNDIEYEFEIEEKLVAPIKTNQQVGTLTFKLDDKVISKTALITTESIEKTTVWGYLVEFLRSFLVINL